MKIIRKGIPPGDIIHEITCHICDSILQFEQQEATKYYDYDGDAQLRIQCPVCKAHISTGLTASIWTNT